MEILTSNKLDHHDLHQAQVWGCLTYVLNPDL